MSFPGICISQLYGDTISLMAWFKYQLDSTFHHAIKSPTAAYEQMHLHRSL